MDNMCDDNRFELIGKYRQKLIEHTNIESSPDEMDVLNDILFRFWQMGWLDKLEEPIRKSGWKKKSILSDSVVCPNCGCYGKRWWAYCPNCGNYNRRT